MKADMYIYGVIGIVRTFLYVLCFLWVRSMVSSRSEIKFIIIIIHT